MQTLSKKAQTWGLDALVATVIFSIAMLLFFFYTVNFNDEAGNKIDSLQQEANSIFGVILSEGSPVNWNNQNVISPGILNDGRVNDTKLESLYVFSQGNYSRLKNFLNTNKDFYFFSDASFNISGIVIDGIGKAGLNRSNVFEHENPENLIKVERAVIYENKPTKFIIYVWD